MSACELCDLDPVEGGSSICDDDGVVHRLCHPLTGSPWRPLSCFEIVGFTVVENQPGAHRAPQEIPPALLARARAFVILYGPR